VSRKKTQWAKASREELEALVESTVGMVKAGLDITPEVLLALSDIQASCTPLRTESEVGVAMLSLVRGLMGDGTPLYDGEAAEAIWQLAKEPTS
jgi:hypothetical protein